MSKVVDLTPEIRNVDLDTIKKWLLTLPKGTSFKTVDTCLCPVSEFWRNRLQYSHYRITDPYNLQVFTEETRIHGQRLKNSTKLRKFIKAIDGIPSRDITREKCLEIIARLE